MPRLRDLSCEQIEARLHKVRCPDEIVQRHMERLRDIRRVKRRQIVRRKNGKAFTNWIAIDGVLVERCNSRRSRGR
jgi:hypothetical protein